MSRNEVANTGAGSSVTDCASRVTQTQTATRTEEDLCMGVMLVTREVAGE